MGAGHAHPLYRDGDFGSPLRYRPRSRSSVLVVFVLGGGRDAPRDHLAVRWLYGVIIVSVRGPRAVSPLRWILPADADRGPVPGLLLALLPFAEGGERTRVARM